LFALAFIAWPHPGHSQNVGSHEESARILTLDNITVKNGGAVSGEVHNRSSRTVRDVQLLVRHTWLWDDERHPGKADPSTSAYHTLQQEIPPQGSARFSFVPLAPLAKGTGGHFETAVSIAGFTEIIPQTR
jgi:hypothetical protein